MRKPKAKRCVIIIPFKSMKIVEIIPHLNAGGAQSLCIDLCREFAKGNDVTLISFFDGGEKKFLDAIKELPIKAFSLHKKKGFSLGFARVLYKAILQEKPDVIHTHLSALGYVCSYRKFKSFPIIHTIHNIPQKEIPKPYRFLTKIRLHQGWNINLVGISKTISTMERLEYHIKNPITTIENGFFPKDLSKYDKTKRFDLISLGRFEEGKNYLFMVDILKELISFSPHINMQIAGSGPQFDEVMAKRDELLLTKVLFLPGFSSDPYSLLCQSRIFILSSKFEGNPISILEAMHAGLVVIAPAVGGIPDIISSDNGILYDPTLSALDVAKKINEILLEPKKINDISKWNIEYSKKYEIDNTARLYLEVFSNSIRKKIGE